MRRDAFAIPKRRSITASIRESPTRTERRVFWGLRLKKQSTKEKRRQHDAEAKPTPRLVGIAHIAERLRLTPRRIQELVGEGLPRVTHSRYAVDAVLDWYFAKLELSRVMAQAKVERAAGPSPHPGAAGDGERGRAPV
jgi:hypothetical protein